MTRYVVGVDGGGTRTRVVVADEHGHVLAQGTSGTTNHDDVPPAQVAKNLELALQEALSRSGLPSDQRFGSVFLGMAGVVSNRDHERVRSIVARTSLANSALLELDHDIRIALAGGLSRRPGVALIAGTGSACYGRTDDGHSWQAGGWGHLLADEGSGYWLGVRGLQAAMRMFDGRVPESKLASILLQELGIESADQVMHRVYVDGMSRTSIAGLAPVILELAELGDEACLALVNEGAEELVHCVETVAKELGFMGAGLEVTFAGSILESASLMRQVVSAQLEAALPAARLVEPELPPVKGACLLALAKLEVDLDVATRNIMAAGDESSWSSE